MEPVHPPTDNKTLLPTLWVLVTSFGREDSTAQSSVKAGTISSLLRMANAIQTIFLRPWPLIYFFPSSIKHTIVDVRVFVHWDLSTG